MKYEGLIIHFLLLLVLIFSLYVLYRVNNKFKDFNKKNSYSKSLAYRAFIILICVIIGFIVSIYREFISLYGR